MSQPLPKPDSDEHAGVVRSAGVVSRAVMASRLTGLAREIAFANFFGGGMAYDAYQAAFRIPNLTRDLLAEGALSSAFVSTFSKQLTGANGRDEAFRLSNRLSTLLVPVLVLVCLAGVVFAPALVDSMFPGFTAIEGKRDLTVLLTRIMMSYLLFVSLSAKAMGMLNSLGQFGIPALASAIFNVTSLGIGLFCAFVVGPGLGIDAITGMAVGTLLGGVCQYLWQVPSLLKHGLRFKIDWAPYDTALRQVLKLMGPAVIGAASVQVNVFVNSRFASEIADASGQIIDGPVSWLSYAFRFMQLPLGLFGVAIASATLPAVSRSAGLGDMGRFRETLSRSLGLVFLLTIPAAVGLIVLSRPIVGFIYERGRFTALDTEQTALALSYYCIGLAAYAAVKVLTPAFYALDDVRIPVVVSAVSIAANYALNWTFIKKLGWGHEGLAFSTSLVAGLSFLALFWAMRTRAGGIEGRRLTRGLAKVLVSSAAMGVVCRLTSTQIESTLGAGFFARAVDLGVSIPLGAAVFYGLCRLLRAEELSLAENALLQRIR